MWAMTGACTGEILSTPCPKLILRTVMVSPIPVFLRAMTVPSYACRRSLSPSLILTCTRIVSPGRNSGTSLFLPLLMNFVNNGLFMTLLSQSLQQFRPQARRLLHRRSMAPAADFLVISAEQHLRRLPASPFRGPRILRAVQDARHVRGAAEGLPQGRVLVAEHSRHKPRHRVYNHRGGQFSTAQHIVANRQFLVGQMLRDALVH